MMGIKTIKKVIVWLLVMILTAPTGLWAQPPGESAAAEQKYTYSQEQIDQLLAPIALYPDPLLSQILMASTYPLEIVEADRWLKKNPNLSGDRLDNALKEKPWDVSVKSLCHFPKVLDMMSEKLDNTQTLGEAFLGQQDQVMDTIQGLRAKARSAGNLASTDKQKVVVEGQYISIDPVTPEVVYVPAYDPCWVYGPWWYPYCAPLWFWWPGIVVGVGFFWWPPFFVGPIDFWCGFFWNRHRLFVNFNKAFVVGRVGITRLHGGVEVWQHDPIHRRGVAFRNPAVARQFKQIPRPGVEARHSFRGFAPEGGRGRPGFEQRGRPEGSTAPRFQQRGEIRTPGPQRFEQPRANPFEGFGHSGHEVGQHSERGFESIGGGHQGGGFGGARGGGAPSRSGAPHGGGGGGSRGR